ncbi:hypothetical protein KIPB_003442 [Kipferlia bialata]|uniref:HD/PDEase domain-containing protein n=1 Tax=Kipferlia bialata TaxID=797122 RepID=A0A9K3CTG6_9EUKA|nr:hypothetical protein KIPB_003442 [Kipferlia bialata]|eukprot:g3442.t1
MTDYSQFLGHVYHVDLVPGCALDGVPVYTSMPEQCSVKGIVSQFSSTYLHLKDATCTYVLGGSELRSTVHGIEHSIRVGVYSLVLLDLAGLSDDASVRCALTAAAFHDSARVHDDVERNHGQRAATVYPYFAAWARPRGVCALPDATRDKEVEAAICLHSTSFTPKFTRNTDMRTSQVARVLATADRLDRPRVTSLASAKFLFPLRPTFWTDVAAERKREAAKTKGRNSDSIGEGEGESVVVTGSRGRGRHPASYYEQPRYKTIAAMLNWAKVPRVHTRHHGVEIGEVRLPLWFVTYGKRKYILHMKERGKERGKNRGRDVVTDGIPPPPPLPHTSD